MKTFGAFNMIVTARNPSTHNNVCFFNFHPTKTTKPFLPTVDNWTYSVCYVILRYNYRSRQISKYFNLVQFYMIRFLSRPKSYYGLFYLRIEGFFRMSSFGIKSFIVGFDTILNIKKFTPCVHSGISIQLNIN